VSSVTPTVDITGNGQSTEPTADFKFDGRLTFKYDRNGSTFTTFLMHAENGIARYEPDASGVQRTLATAAWFVYYGL
jgi:hypothetical protein